MSKILVLNSSILSDSIKNLLIKQQIITVIDFLIEDAYKLAQICQLTIKEIENIKTFIYENYGCKVCTAYDIYQQMIKTTFSFKSGIQSFDNILGNGLLSGNLYEVCGLSSAGKTQLCKMFALNLAITYSLETLYIDTHQNFSAVRVQKMLESRNLYTKSENCLYMKQIKCERIYTVEEFLNILYLLTENSEETKNIKLIIVDSLPSMWLTYQGKYIQTGLKLLSKATHLMRKLAAEHHKTFLLVNFVTRWNPTESGKFSTANTTPSSDQTKHVPALGKYWLSVPSTRFSIRKLDLQYVNPVTNVSKRIIEIVKSNQYKCGKDCTVTITDTGIM